MPPVADERLHVLSERFRSGAAEFVTSPLYRALARGVADDAELLALAAEGRAGQQPTNLLFGAVHFLVLGSPQADLARYYASIVDDPLPAEDAMPHFRAFSLERRNELLALLRMRLVQTNVVKRSAALRLGLAAVGEREREVALLEVGASAGLNLLFDRYEYRLGGRTFGHAGSPVSLEVDWRGFEPPDLDALPEVTARAGLDLNPVDLADPVERRWLRALVWPEDRTKARLLDAACAIAADAPPRLVAGDAVGDLAPVAAELGDEPLVVFHSATRAHVPLDLRPTFDAAIEGLAASRSLYWLSLEGAGMLHEHPRGVRGPHLLGVTSIVRGHREDRLLALVDPHGEWLEPVEG